MDDIIKAVRVRVCDSVLRHIFHKSCVDPWLLDHRTCPMCKMNILKALGIPVRSFCLSKSIHLSFIPNPDPGEILFLESFFLFIFDLIDFSPTLTVGMTFRQTMRCQWEARPPTPSQGPVTSR